MPRQKHIIARQIFELNFNSEQAAKKIPDVVPQLMESEILPRLDQFLSKCCKEGETILIDKLVLDLGSIGIDDFKEVLPGWMILCLENAMQSYITGLPTAGQEARILNYSESWIEIFIHFLKYGVLPWWIEDQSLELIEARILTESYDHGDLLTERLFALNSDSLALRRLVMQFSDQFNLELIKALFPDDLGLVSFTNHLIPETIISEAGDTIEIQPDELRIITMSLLWKALLSSGNASDKLSLVSAVIADLCDELKINPEVFSGKLPFSILPVSGKHSVVIGQHIDNKNLAADPQGRPDTYFISNAGLVILWPFMEKLYDNLGYLRKGAFMNIEKQERALLVTNFLINGGYDIEEQWLPLNKLLTGWPLPMPVKKYFRITTKERNESLMVLQSVITHWKALKNTSIRGLRETFLWRNGIISSKGQGWQLNVERKTVDVLLDQLPWSMSTIKLPWMDEILFVEW